MGGPCHLLECWNILSMNLGTGASRSKLHMDDHLGLKEMEICKPETLAARNGHSQLRKSTCISRYLIR